MYIKLNIIYFINISLRLIWMWYLDFKEKGFHLKEKDCFYQCKIPNETITLESGSGTVFKIFHGCYHIAVRKLKSGKLIPLVFWFIISLNTFKVRGAFYCIHSKFSPKKWTWSEGTRSYFSIFKIRSGKNKKQWSILKKSMKTAYEISALLQL